MRATHNQLPVDVPQGYVDQMRNVVRFHEIDEMGRRVVGYKSLGHIDYLMSEVYDFFAGELLKAEVLGSEMSEETVFYLDDHFEFERSNLNQLETDDYRTGFVEDMMDTDDDWRTNDEEWNGGWEESL